MTTDDARTEFLRGAQRKADALNELAAAQLEMEAAAWRLVDEGTPKARVPALLQTWLEQSDTPNPGALGVSEHTVISRWLNPRNRPTAHPEP